MKVVFLTDVRGQGKKGDLKEVSEGYARNYLLPRKLVAEATADVLNAIKLKEKANAAREAKERALAVENSKKLEGVQVVIRAKSGNGGKLFGAVTSAEICQALKEQHDIDIEKNKLVQGDPIKAYGTYTVKAKLGYEVTASINLLVIEG